MGNFEKLYEKYLGSSKDLFKRNEKMAFSYKDNLSI
jgi:hypothetical protein